MVESRGGERACGRLGDRVISQNPLPKSGRVRDNYPWSMGKYFAVRALSRGQRAMFPLCDWFHTKLIVRGLRPRNVYDLFLQRAEAVWLRSDSA
jgi:hypothetical protein